MKLDLGCIVEGKAEVESLPILVCRVWQDVCPDLPLRIAEPWRVPHGKMAKRGELEKAVESLARRLAAPRAILIVMDADDDPPCTKGPEMLSWATEARPDIPIGLAMANREYESWFLASLPSLGGHCGIPVNPPVIDNPESNRDAKGVLTSLMPRGNPYKETAHQAALTRVFDMQLARRRSDSFDKCWREIERLLGQATQTEGGNPLGREGLGTPAQEGTPPPHP